MLWGMRPVEPQAAYGIAVDRLRRQIHSGLLLPEERLPSERKLSDEFGISRMTLREALRVLETDRYLSVRRGAQGGAFVTDAHSLTVLSKRRIAREPGAAMRVLEFLCANQSAAARYAADRCGVAELKRMRFAIDLMRNSTSMAALKQAESFFHLALADATKIALMARAIEDALAELFLPYPEAALVLAQQETLDQHTVLLAAIESGDQVRSEQAIQALHEGYWAQLRGLTRSAA